MEDKERRDRIIQKLAAISTLYPKQRFMQLLLNILSNDETIYLFYLEDDKLENMLDEVLLNYDK
jgi:hypothetical protein